MVWRGLLVFEYAQYCKVNFANRLPYFCSVIQHQKHYFVNVFLLFDLATISWDDSYSDKFPLLPPRCGETRCGMPKGRAVIVAMVGALPTQLHTHTHTCAYTLIEGKIDHNMSTTHTHTHTHTPTPTPTPTHTPHTHTHTPTPTHTHTTHTHTHSTVKQRRG